ncbi:MAG: AbrB/MazE/SpoVT family DNA-binding domain-containing protein [Dehalococcoidales bacterium]|nr:AbrB/MazE/SpoVT family DNA-binding domain-containing protein [Dehalococcoidales bacterium]
MEVVVRPKRQVTLPKEICRQLKITPGDTLEISLEDSKLVARPKKKIALEALSEIQQAFKRSGITEEELQQAGHLVRRKLLRSRHAAKA